MDPVTIGLIVSNVISWILHGLHLKTECKGGCACCQVTTELEEDGSTIPLQKQQ